MEAYTDLLAATLLLSLRMAPTFGFAPPFTLLRTPGSIRLLLSLALALWIVLANPAQTSLRIPDVSLMTSAALELLLGIALAITLQLAFAAILMAGRALDIQAGFSLAQLADPTLRTQMPLIGTLLSYGAAAVFFSTEGPADLLAIWAASVNAIPLGGFGGRVDLDALLSFVGAVFVAGVGLVALVLLALLLVDLTVAFMSRTLPQMNVLVLGFQVKTLTLLVTLPLVFGLSGALFLRIIRLAIDATPRLI